MNNILILKNDKEISEFLLDISVNKEISKDKIIILSDDLGVKKSKHWKSWIKSLGVPILVKRSYSQDLYINLLDFII